MIMFDKGMPRIREVVGVFRRYANRQAAISSLLQEGFDSSNISVLEKDEAMARQFGLWFGKAIDLSDANRPPRRAYVSPADAGEGRPYRFAAIAIITALVAVIAGFSVALGQGRFTDTIVAAIGGGAIGFAFSLIGEIIWRRHSIHRLSGELMGGGTPLWVRTFSEAEERKARSVMKSHSATGAHTHMAGLDPYAQASKIATGRGLSLAPRAVRRASQ